MLRLTTEAFFRAVSGSDITWRLLFAHRPNAAEAAAVHEEVQAFATEPVTAALRQLPEMGNLLPGVRLRACVLRGRRGGLGYVGLEWQHSFASAPLHGVGRDATYLARRLS
ncbi:MAG TPA: hypothetical protein VJT49_21545 [Amycolatopsis sp.]|uniref:hypothetical protein n=1 Tax=Amycolatopsis sp. TaxID=37632 RepID=UPI002B49D1BB|nr:hypothetical protein [Amycolatopsis sp.]HKS47646.1 hypothetical protein [Amycolatopsis sp.]